MTIESGLNNLDNTKAAIKQAIENHGVSVPVSTTFAEYPTKIASIPSASEYVGYLDDIETVLETAGVEVPASYADLDTTIATSYSEIASQLSEINTSGGAFLTGIPREVSAQGVFQMPSADFVYTLPEGATDVGDYAFWVTFDRCERIVGADFSGLTTISGNSAMMYCFRDCSNLASVDFSNVETISGSYPLNCTFRYCTSLTSISFPSLHTIRGYQAFYYAFDGCTDLVSVSFPNLEVITSDGGGVFYGAFNSCSSLEEITFPKLYTMRTTPFTSAFNYCTSLKSISFPSLCSIAFGSYTQPFYRMLTGVTGCTVHFPTNLQDIIGEWSDVTTGFGGTNTTVLFDLPRTEVKFTFTCTGSGTIMATRYGGEVHLRTDSAGHFIEDTIWMPINKETELRILLGTPGTITIDGVDYSGSCTLTPTEDLNIHVTFGSN